MYPLNKGKILQIPNHSLFYKLQILLKGSSVNFNSQGQALRVPSFL